MARLRNISIVTGGSTPAPGSVVAFAGPLRPQGWFFCQGQTVSRTLYWQLFDVIGTIHGAGDGVTTFNLPDLRQRFILGRAVSGPAGPLGNTGGAIDHTHSVPAHHHALGAGADLNIVSSGAHTTAIDHDHAAETTGTMNSNTTHAHGYTDPGHLHSTNPREDDGTVTGPWFLAAVQTTQPVQPVDTNVGNIGITINNTNIDHTHNLNLPNFVGNSAATGNHAHATVDFAGRIGLVTGGIDGNISMTSGTNNPPFYVLNYIIKQ